MNRGLSPELKLAFPDVVAVILKQSQIKKNFHRPRPQAPRRMVNKLRDSHLPKGCFHISIFKATTITGYAVKLGAPLNG